MSKMAARRDFQYGADRSGDVGGQRLDMAVHLDHRKRPHDFWKENFVAVANVANAMPLILTENIGRL